MAVLGPLTDAGVSEREAEVLDLLGDHLTNAEIAHRLFISVRTVESHVSSLLRKLDQPDRRKLAGLAASLRTDARPDAAGSALPSLPSPLTSFVGRVGERAALAESLAGHRLVTAVGPGGVGKTRLALAVAAHVTGRYADRAWYVDLVPVTDAAMVGAAVATAFGFGEQPGRSPTDTVVAKLADAEALVVLDNCEHLVEGVSVFVERLLSSCPRVTALAASRVRLHVPFESVFWVPGLSVDDGADGDATALFVERAAMAGWSAPYPLARRRIATICKKLDGIALAIELAAARVATIGLDGLEAGLDDQLALLAGGPRLDARHRSVRSALDWSFGLLGEQEQVVLRRTSVFAASFTAEQAAAVVGPGSPSPAEVAVSLARLADHSLLVVNSDANATRYRMLETIRQYGAERMVEVGEETDVRGRHLRWCLATAASLAASHGGAPAPFDRVADDLRAGLRWAATEPELRADAHMLAALLARLAYASGLPSEAQERYEQAATLAPDPAAAAGALHCAACVAWGRHLGNDAMRLYRAGADAARRAGDRRRAALELVSAAQLITNAPGIMSPLPTPGAERTLLADASALASGDVNVEAAMLTITTPYDDVDPVYADLADRAVELAHRVGDTRLESHALDQVTATRLVCGEVRKAAATARRRVELVTPRIDDVEMAWEHSDALHMAPVAYLAVGDLRAADRYARQRSELSSLREADHLAVEWLLTTAAVAGDLDEAVALAQRFRRGWTEAGRPAIGGIAFAPAAAAMVYGIKGDDDARLQWLGIIAEMRRAMDPVLGARNSYRPFFDAVVALHRGDTETALTHVAAAPESFKAWQDAAWRPWYAAVWAEAGVLAALPDRESRLDRARFLVRDNPIASAMVERAGAIDCGDPEKLQVAAEALRTAGCRYQSARTLIFAGGDARARGEAIMAAIGAEPTVTGRHPIW